MLGFTQIRVNRVFLTLTAFLLILFPHHSFANEGQVTIEVGTLSAEDGDEWVLSQIRGFEKAHPNVDIRHFAIGSPSRDEVRIQDLPELALNVIGVRSDMGYEIGYLVENDLIVPIESFLPDPEFEFGDFFANVWDYVNYQEKHWGVPFLCSSVVLIADWDVFEKSGVREAPKSWEDLLRVLPSLTKDTDGDGATDQWGFRLGMRERHDTHMFYLWMTKVLQDGGHVMKDGRFDLSHPSLLNAYELMDRLQNSPGAHTDNRRFKNTAGDLTFRYGIQIAPSYYLNPLMKQVNYRIIPWVTSGEEVIFDERRHYLCVGKSTPEKEKASWEFLKWITRQGAEHPDGAWTFHLSARKDLLERKDVRHKIEAWAKGFDVMHETKGWNVHHGDQVLGRFEAMDHFEKIITDLFRGNLSYEEAVKKAEQECNAILLEFQTTDDRVTDTPEITEQKMVAESHWKTRQYKQAALDYLKLWSRYPESVQEQGIRLRIIACLKSAGYFLEADSLATSGRPSVVAGLILKDFQSGDPLTEFYVRNTPNEEVLNQSELGDPENIHQLIHTARIASVSAFYGKPSSHWIDHFTKKCRDLLKPQKEIGENWPVVAVYHRGIIDLALRLQTNGDGTRSLSGAYELNSSTSNDYAQRLAEDTIAIASVAAESAPNLIPLVFDALDTRIEVGRKAGDLDGIVAGYQAVTDRFPNSEESPKYLLDLAVLLRNEVRDLEAAVAACRGLELRYPENQFSKEARLKRAIWLYEANRFDEAKPILESIIKAMEEDSDTAVVLSALCDYALGSRAEAEEVIRGFVAANPRHDLAQRAHGWLISNRIADFRFLEATQMIRTLNEISPSAPNLSPIEKRLQDPSY